MDMHIYVCIQIRITLKSKVIKTTVFVLFLQPPSAPTTSPQSATEGRSSTPRPPRCDHVKPRLPRDC